VSRYDGRRRQGVMDRKKVCEVVLAFAASRESMREVAAELFKKRNIDSRHGLRAENGHDE